MSLLDLDDAAFDALYLRQNPDTAARTIDGEAIVITPRDSVLHTLNETATFVWEHADGTRTLGGLCLLLVDAFDAPADVIAADARAFVREAIRCGVLIASTAPA